MFVSNYRLEHLEGSWSKWHHFTSFHSAQKGPQIPVLREFPNQEGVFVARVHDDGFMSKAIREWTRPGCRARRCCKMFLSSMNHKVSVADATAFWQNLSGSYLSDISKHFCHLLLGHVADPMFDLHDSGRYMKKYEKIIPCCHTTSPHITICILNCCMIWFCALREDNDHIWPVLSPIAGNVLCLLGQTSTSGRQYALLGSVLGTPWSFFFNLLECFFSARTSFVHFVPWDRFTWFR